MPTIATMVPRAAFAWVTRRLKGRVRVPLIATNRINDPAVAEDDPRARRRRHGVDGAAVPRRPGVRAQGGRRARRRDQHLHRVQPGLPRPHLRATRSPRAWSTRARAARTSSRFVPASVRRSAWPSSAPARPGSRARRPPPSAATRSRCSRRRSEIGGQFNLARRIPGKEEFAETLRYYRARLARLGVTLALGRAPTRPTSAGFDDVVLATGIVPRMPAIPGIDHPKVASYVDIVSGRRVAGARVAIVGAGGIGFDVAELLTHPGGHAPVGRRRGPERGRRRPARARRVPRPLGHRRRLRARRRREAAGARALAAPGLAPPAQGVEGRRGPRQDDRLDPAHAARSSGASRCWAVSSTRGIDDAGLHVVVDGKPQVLDVDTIVICAGQEPRRDLVAALEASGRAGDADRRRRRRARAGREARDRAGDAGRDGAVGSDPAHLLSRV